MKRNINEIENFYEVYDDKREYQVTGELSVESRKFWLWHRLIYRHSIIYQYNYYYVLLLPASNIVITMCGHCYNGVDDQFWKKVAWHYKNVSLILVHEHFEGHLNCDLCQISTCALSNPLQCYWERVIKRLEVVKIWGAREN